MQVRRDLNSGEGAIGQGIGPCASTGPVVQGG